MNKNESPIYKDFNNKNKPVFFGCGIIDTNKSANKISDEERLKQDNTLLANLSMNQLGSITKPELEYLQKYWQEKTVDELANDLFRTGEFIRSSIDEFCFKDSPITDNEEKYIKDNYNIKSIEEMSRFLHRTVDFITAFIECYGIDYPMVISGKKPYKQRKMEKSGFYSGTITPSESSYIDEFKDKKTMQEISQYLSRDINFIQDYIDGKFYYGEEDIIERNVVDNTVSETLDKSKQGNKDGKK